MTHNHYQLLKYFSMTEHLIIPEILVFSRKAWEGLSKDDQALIKKFAREAQIEERELWDKMVQEALMKLKEAGVTIVADVDKPAFQASVKPVYEKYGAKYGELIKRIEAVE